jgi:2'-5' RNA ligase
MRLFVGIPLAAETLAELANVVARLRSSADGLRWTEPESWHITLQFLGNTDPDQYPCLMTQLSEVHSKPVPIHLAELGVFDRAGIFFADVVPTPELVSLAGRVIAATAGCGFVAESRPYHPHITLARARGKLDKRQSHAQSVAPSRVESKSHPAAPPDPHPLRALQQRIHHQPAFPPFLADQFVLYESHLNQTGSTYEIRHRFPLAVPR